MTEPTPPRPPAPVRVGGLLVSPPLGIAPMAGLTDSPFRRLVKRAGGCGLVVSEMVSAEGIVRGGDRTLEYAEFTDEERPVAIQIFGSDPDRMAEAAAAIAEGGADLIDVNMGCPVPKIAGNHSGSSLMRDPDRAERIVAAMTSRVRVPVTVKMRAGWDDRQVNAPELARRLEGAGAAAVAVHGRTAAQSYRGEADWTLIARVAQAVSIPVFGNGDLLLPEQVVECMRRSGVAGVLVGRGIARNPWLLAQASDVAAGRGPREVTPQARRDFLLDYIDLLTRERVRSPSHRTVRGSGERRGSVAGHQRWIVGKVRSLTAWFSKGLEGGSRLRAEVNRADSLDRLREIIRDFAAAPAGAALAAPGRDDGGREAVWRH